MVERISNQPFVSHFIPLINCGSLSLVFFFSIFAEAGNHRDVFKMSESKGRIWFVLSADREAEGGPGAKCDVDADRGGSIAAAAGVGANLQHPYGPV